MRRMSGFAFLFAVCLLSSCTATLEEHGSTSSSKSIEIFSADEEIRCLVSSCQKTVISDFIDNEDNGVFLLFDPDLNETRILSLWTYDPNRKNKLGNEQKSSYLFFAYLHSIDDGEDSENDALRTYEIDIVAIMELKENKHLPQTGDLNDAIRFTRVFLNSGFIHHGARDEIWYVIYDARKNEAKEITDMLVNGFHHNMNL